jgi:acetyltransferase-like isoleucine patch superfamily enzyme
MKTFPPYPGLGPGQYIQAENGIYIGRNVRMGPGVKIISANHNLENFEQHDPSEPIYIGDFCWLGANCVILPGVNLGSHVIIAAGAVVTKSFKENDIVIGGVPAKKIKDIGPYKGGLPENVTILKV